MRHELLRGGGTPPHALRSVARGAARERLLGLFASPSPTAAAGGEDECASTPNPIACENALPGRPAERLAGRGRRRSVDPGLRHVDERQRRRRPSHFKINTPSSAYHIDILRLGYYGGDGARLVAANIQPTATLPQTQPACLHEAVDRADRLRQLGRLGLVDGAEQRGLGRLHRASGARRHGRREPDPLRRAQRRQPLGRSCCRPPTRPGRPTTPTAATASTRCTVACPPGNPHAYKGAYAVSYNRPFDGALRDRRRRVLPVLRRVPDDRLARGERLRRQLHRARPTSTATARC